MKKFIKVTLALVGCVSLFLLYVQISYQQKFEAPVVTGIKASTDSAVIAHGRYLVYSVAHCYTCHMPDSLIRLKQIEHMIGGHVFETPFATFYTPNLTPDSATGIGRYSDEQLARSIRYSINHDNNAMAPFMTYNAMSDNDLTAIISYLRSTIPVRNEVPPHDLNMVGKILMRFVIKPPVIVPENIAADTTVEYGRYLAYNVANCRGCHTNRGATGEFVGDPFAGGYRWDLGTVTLTSPNLTPHDTTGWIYAWSEKDFINRFKRGRTFPESPMPWEAFSTMSENDVKAIYRFLRSLPPSSNKVERTYAVKETEL